MAKIPLALPDVHILDGLRLEAVLPVLVRVGVADILDVRVHELVDIEDDVELLPLAHEVAVVEETMMGFLMFVGGVPGPCRRWRG